MWRRGDVREAPLIAESLYTPRTVFEWSEDRKPLPLAAALVGKVGYRFVDRPRKPTVRDIARYWDPGALRARSITGELSWDARYGVVHVDTPRSQVVIGFLSTQAHILRDVRLTTPNRFGAVYVTAISGAEPLASARRILVTAVGPARNTGMEYENTGKMSRLGPLWRLKSPGKAPALLEAITGVLRIRNAHAASLKAWTLDVVGNRRAPVPLLREEGGVTLQMQPEHETVYYELATE
jgi:hypothetical protein